MQGVVMKFILCIACPLLVHNLSVKIFSITFGCAVDIQNLLCLKHGYMRGSPVNWFLAAFEK